MFITFLVALCVAIFALAQAAMPPPFTRELYVTSPVMTGNDVLIAQTLLQRDSAVSKSFTANGKYDDASAAATSAFQSAHALKATGKLDDQSAQLLLDLHSDDNYSDTGFTAASMGYKYKVYIPVHNNRSVETMATLYDANNKVLLNFRVRTHGHRGDGTTQAWPDYGDGDVGLNQFTSSGNTVTGLVEIDLNSPEPDPNVYGPWPVNRIVRGLDGNAKLCKLFSTSFLLTSLICPLFLHSVT